MKLVRWLLGRIILTINWLTWPAAAKRPAEKQQLIDLSLKGYSLYQFHACPFCVKVRREMQRLSLPIELRDAKNEPHYRQELQQNGGAIKVPCLRIVKPDGTSQWMYESDDIIQHLRTSFPL